MTDRALLVGINKYPYPNELRGCVNDVFDMKENLVQQCGFPRNCEVFTDPADLSRSLRDPAAVQIIQDAAATAEGIKSALQAVVSTLRAGDRFLFHYSGHGAQLEDGNAATDVICPVDFDFTPATSVTVSDFHAIFREIPAGVAAVWISDSCHSGDLERDLYRHGVPKRFNPRNAGERSRADKLRQLRSPRTISDSFPNIALLSGCTSDQTSADAWFNNRYNGALTYFLLRTLETGGNQQAPLTVLISRVRAALGQAHYEQNPQLSGTPTAVNRSFLQPAPADTNPRDLAPTIAFDPTPVARELMATINGRHQVAPGVPTDWVSRMSAALGGDLTEAAIARYITSPPPTMSGETARELVSEGRDSTVHAYWWGLRITLSHEDVATFAAKDATAATAALATAIGTVAGPAAPFIAIAGAFVALELYWLRATDEDHGNSGAALVMTWLAPGVFVVLPN